MKETVMYVTQGQGKILTIDVSADLFYIAYTDKKEIITPHNKKTIDAGTRRCLVRRVDNNTFLLAYTPEESVHEQVHLYDFDGTLISSFIAGYGIEDIIVLQEKIVVSYFDEGVFSHDPTSSNGIAVFDLGGHLQFGFNEQSPDLKIADCYCMCTQDDHHLLFYAYDFFRLVQLDLRDYSWKVFGTPEQVRGASAISCTGDVVIFHDPYDDAYALYSWDMVSHQLTRTGTYMAALSGINQGKFLAYGDRGFTIVDMQAHEW